MSTRRFGDPCSSKSDLRHGGDCGCTSCAHQRETVTDMAETVEITIPRPCARDEIVEHPNDYAIRSHLVHFLSPRSPERRKAARRP